MRLSLLMILSIQLVWFLPHLANSKCSDGCLACSGASNQCLICNVHEYYILNEYKGCTRIPIENCSIPSAEPGKMACDLCKSGFSLDNATRKCVEVPSIHKDDNCEHYHWDDSCVVCKDKFYLDVMTRRCHAIKTEVANCVTYEDAKTCRSCADGYFYNLGTNTCEQITKIKDCLLYSSVECQACSAGYFQVSNLEGNSDLSVNLIQSMVNSNLKESGENFALYDSQPINKCVKGGLSKCKVHESFKTCKECQNGYFLDSEKQCKTNPLRMIAQCKAYNEKGLCITCATGYYADEGRCLAISTVSGCLKYDVTNHYCLDCNQATHYKSGNSCGIRIKSANITHCKTLNTTDDLCSVCIDSFQLTNDNLFCLPHIPHCKQYIGSNDVTNTLHTNSTTQFLQCDVCNDYFYRDGGKLNCLPQEKPGCSTFTVNTNDCTACATGFYHSGTSCFPRTVTNCLTYKNNEDKCNTCHEAFYFKDKLCHPYTKTTCLTFSSTEDHCGTCPLAFFKVSNDCKPYTATNCKTYHGTENKCTACFYGFYLDTNIGKSCYPITLKNCIAHTANLNQCSKCVPGHYLIANKCHKYTASGCATYVTTKNECNACEGERFKDTVSNECLAYTVSNCNGYKTDADECTNCPTGYFKDIRNNCQPKTIENCSAYSTSDTDGKCQTCDDGFELLDGYCYKKKLVGCQTYSGTNCATCSSGFYKQSNICQKITAKFCAEFKTDANECSKCIPGYKKQGTDCIPAAIAFCSKYKEDLTTPTCIGCKRGYFLTNAAGGTCSQLTIVGCVEYTPNTNTCTKCRPGLVLTEQVCGPATQNIGCIHIKESDSSKCKTCAKSYYLDSTSFTCKPVPEITNCREYYLNTKLCKYCNAGLKPRNDNLGCEPAVNAPNCKVQTYNSDKCALCTPGYYLQSDGSCVIQQIDHCLEYVQNKNQCLKCQKGYLEVSDQCSRFMEKAPNCARLASNLKDCRICENGFYLTSNGNCLAQVGDGCRLFAPNSNNCVDCQDNLSLKDGVCYRTMSQPNCYSVDPQTENCTMCNKEYYNKSGNGFCVRRHVVDSSKKVWDENCVANFDISEQKCTLCQQFNPSYTFVNHSMPTDSGVFTGCHTADNTYACTQCKESYDKRTTNPKCTVVTGATSLCLQMKLNSTDAATIDTPGQCAKCRDETKTYFASATCTAASFFNCKKMGTSTTICNTCNDNAILTLGGTFTSSFECGKRTNDSITASSFGDTNCLVVSDATAACALCKGDKTGNDCTGTALTKNYLVNLDATFNIIPKLDTATSTTLNEGGLIVNAAPIVGTTVLKISHCTKTHSLNIINTLLTQLEDKTAFKPAVGTETNAKNKNIVEFFRSYMTIESCLDVFSTASHRTLIYKKVDNAEEQMPVYTAAQYKITTTEKQACMYWELVASATDKFLRCRGCAPNHIPVGMFAIKYADLDGTGSADLTVTKDSEKAAIMSCRDLAGTGAAEIKESGHDYLEKAYQGLDYGFTDLWHSLNVSRSVFVNFDNCKKPNSTDLDAALFVFGYYQAAAGTSYVAGNLKGSILPFPFMINSVYQNNIWCLKMDNTQFFSEDLSLNASYKQHKLHFSTQVDNCQIYLYNLPNASDTDGIVQNFVPGTIISEANSANIKCLACRPGYKPTITGTASFVSACTIIAECDQTAATNTWMNACSKCKDGFGWSYASKTIAFDQCVANSSYLHCLVVDSGGSKCRLCKTGYSMNHAYQCVAQSRDTVCTSAGMPVHALENDMAGTPKNFINFDYMLYRASNMSDHDKISPYCISCVSGTYLHQKTIANTANSSELCLYGTFFRTAYSPKKNLDNCDTVLEANNQKCIKCKTNYVVVSDDNALLSGSPCKLTSTVPNFISNCKVIENTAAPNCLACNDTFTLYTPDYIPYAANKKQCFSELITATNCDVWNTSNNFCDVCKKNFVYDTAKEYMCKAATASNGNCIREGRKGQCLECHGANYFPIHYKKTDATKRVQYSYHCVDQGSSKMQSYEGIIFGYDLKTNVIFEEMNSPVPSDILYIPTLNASHADFGTHVHEKRINLCMLQNSAALTTNCAKWNQKGFQCSECNYRYYLQTKTDDHNKCIAYAINNCRIQNGIVDTATPTCKTCEYGWKLSSNKQACEKVHTDNCLYYDYINNECFVCKDGYYLKSADLSCVKYTEIENCHIRNPFNNECENCALGYIVNLETGKCDRNSVKHCQLPSSEIFGFCDRCIEGYQVTSGSCSYLDNGSNCNEVNASGLCTSCFPGYELVNDKCIEEYFKPIPGCVVYDQVGVLCTECDEGMIFAGGYCLKQASENCEVLWEGVNACRRCKKDYYLKDSSCKRRQVTNCHDYADDSDTCTACAPTLLLKDGACMEYSAQYCDIYHPDEDRCLSCAAGHYINTLNQLCVHYSVINCKSFDPFRDMCSLCLPDYYRTNKGLCLARTTDKCVKTDPYQDVCIECDKDYYLSDKEHASTPGSGYLGYGSDFKNDCKPYTVLNCLDFNPRADKCMTCPEGFFMNTTNHNCYPGTKLNCKEWNADRTGCLNCPEGTYIDNKICYGYTAKGCGSFDPTKDLCLSCKPGQYLNNGNCLQRTAMNCKESHPTADLCQSCPSGFFLSNFTCVRHTKKHCAEFAVGSDYCLTCENNFFFNNGSCLPYSVTCLSYDPNRNACTACPSEQFLEIRNSLCVDYTVQNCATLNPSANKCVSCDDEYYWENGLCKAYTVNHCNIYHTLFDECVTCKNGFYPMGRDCKEYDVKNCSKKSPVADICLVCESGYYNFKGFCNPYTAQNCLTFNPMRDACLTCKAGAFFRQSIEKDFFVCEPAKVVEQCKTYNTNKNACAQCQDGYYFEPLKNTCLKNPSAVPQCSIYSSTTTCKECIAPYYLDVNKNQCVKSDLQIDKCIYYSSNSRCGKCEGANLLRPDKQLCERIIEFSCKTYKDNRNCETCDGNSIIQYIRDTDNSKVSGLNGEDLTDRRAICEPSNIDNCADAQEGYPLPTCNICNKGFFKAGPSQCQIVLQTIDKCETYFKDGVCAECEPNHLLNHSKDACEFDLTFLGDNCQEGKFFSEPHCARCKTGFYFNASGDCTPCSMDGCAVCSAISSSTCKLCKNGYYMNSTLTCIKSGTKKLAKMGDEKDCDLKEMMMETADTGLDSVKGVLGAEHGSNHKEYERIMTAGLVFIAIAKFLWM